MSTCSRPLRMGMCIIPTICAMISTGCRSETKRVFVEYTAPADHFEVLEKASPASPIRVCLGNIDVSWRVEDPGHLRSSVQSECVWTYSDYCGRTAKGTLSAASNTETEQNRYGQLWANAIRSQIADLLTRQAAAAGANLELIDRDRLKIYLDEKDLALADIIQGDQLTEKAQLLPVDLFVFGRIEGQTIIRTKMETNPALTIASFSPYGGCIARGLNRPKQRIQRTVTFAGNLALHETVTGRVLVSHGMANQTIEDDRAKPWQSDRTEVDLMPEDQVIRAKLEMEVRRFVGRLLPTPIEHLYTVKSSRNKASKEAVKRLGLGEDEAAFTLFKTALRESPEDHRSAFAAGVTCERLGRLSEAEGYYRRAVMNSRGKKDKKGTGESQYLAALQGVKERLLRISGGSAQAESQTLVQSP